MTRQKIPSFIFIYPLCWIFILSCNTVTQPGDEKIVMDPDQMDVETSKSIKLALAFALQHKGVIDDSIQLRFVSPVIDFYKIKGFATTWSHKGKWDPLADSLFGFIQKGELFGLFPKDYHYKYLRSLKSKLETDSLKRMDAELWTRADLVLTDGFMHLINDLKFGRLPSTNTYLHATDTVNNSNFYDSSLQILTKNKKFSELISSMEPNQVGYRELKRGIPRFLDSMDRKEYTYISYPFKAGNVKDSIFFIKAFQKRLLESSCIKQDTKIADSTELNTAIKKYQKKKGVKPDGKISAALIRLMNLTDLERFKRIAINLDRYKQLPSEMPEKYIWVNLPAYYLKLWVKDSLALESKIICGKPATRTPLLYSVISNMVTYPTWTVPSSIISKQYLPKLKNNPNYLSEIGMQLINEKGETIDPGSVFWNNYSKGIPFKVMQASGDDNALGVMKFNFENPYSVYLHDTNQRYLFKNASRALSHGCVRVQQWEELAFFIARNDSANTEPGVKLSYTVDSIKTWLSKKEKRRIGLKNGIPLYIAYFSCEGKNDKIKFYDDIYGEDRLMREKCFSDK